MLMTTLCRCVETGNQRNPDGPPALDKEDEAKTNSYSIARTAAGMPLTPNELRFELKRYD